MQSFDAIVVGGGPAGSSCAWGLKRAGLRVVVLDKSAFPRDKPCAGWITPRVLELREVELSEYGRNRVVQPIDGFVVGRAGGRAGENRYDRPISYGIRRCEFDTYLLQRSGAECRLGTSLRSLERQGDGWRINGEIETPMVVGAGGHFCPVARHLGANPGRAEMAVAAQEVEFEMSAGQAANCPIRPDLPELYFCKDLQGYGWAFRKGPYLNVGLGREDPERLGEHVEQFVGMLQQQGRIPRDTPDRFRGHAYILYGHTRRRLYGDGVVLAGDAAGLAYPYSGEGIRTAIESGLMAADAIVAARGEYAAERLQSYSEALSARFGDAADDDGWLGRIPTWLKRAVARPLFASRWFTRRVVLEGWFLHERPGERGVVAV